MAQSWGDEGLEASVSTPTKRAPEKHNLGTREKVTQVLRLLPEQCPQAMVMPRAEDWVDGGRLCGKLEVKRGMEGGCSGEQEVLREESGLQATGEGRLPWPGRSRPGGFPV